ncbi:MAG: hypothetical protein IT427_16425 [Pirellulales bacterium]|nr:hypothetical protein [Pirellulales bacterium]
MAKSVPFVLQLVFLGEIAFGVSVQFRKIFFVVEMKKWEKCDLPEQREGFRGIHFRSISGGVCKKTAGGSEMDREFTGVYEV